MWLLFCHFVCFDSRFLSQNWRIQEKKIKKKIVCNWKLTHDADSTNAYYFFFELQVDFGEVFIPVGLDVPKPRVLPEFKRLAHGLRSSNISILDAKTFYIPNLHYDGAGPDAYFWVGNGSEPDLHGTKVIIHKKSKKHIP
jgi:Electron transfer DM13